MKTLEDYIVLRQLIFIIGFVIILIIIQIKEKCNKI